MLAEGGWLFLILCTSTLEQVDMEMPASKVQQLEVGSWTNRMANSCTSLSRGAEKAVIEWNNGINQFCAMNEFRSMSYRYIFSYEKILNIKFDDCGSILLINECLKSNKKNIGISHGFKHSCFSKLLINSNHLMWIQVATDILNLKPR